MRLRPPVLLFALIAFARLDAAFDPVKDLLVRWSVPDPRAVKLLRDTGFSFVFIPSTADPAFVHACRVAGLVPIAEIQSPDESSVRSIAEKVAQSGFVGVAFEAFGSEESVRSLVAGHGTDFFVYLKPDQVHWNVAPAYAVLRGGRWPGLTPVDPMEASASAAPWVDANSWLVAWLRAMFPQRPAVLGYRPDEDAGVSKDRVVHYDSLELALADAFSRGGNVVLHPPESHQKALLDDNPRAVAAWQSLARTARFLKENLASFSGRVASRVAVAAGSLEQSGEMLNMMYRRNVTPMVFSVRALESWEPGDCRVLVAVNIERPGAVGARRMLEFARAGGTVLAAPPAAGEPEWWRNGTAKPLRADRDREVHALGKGRLIGYRENVADPSEFSLDVIDALGMSNRDLRIWAADSVIGILNSLPDGRKSVTLVNYGSPLEDWEFLVRVEGLFRRVVLRVPESAAVELPLTRRDGGTEVNVGHLRRVAAIELE